MNKNLSIENIINFRRARAKKQFVLKQSKSDCWYNYASTLTSPTPLQEIWSKVKEIKEISNNVMTNIVTKSSDVTTRNREIAELLAIQFANASSTLNYNKCFLEHKNVLEQNSLINIKN